MLQKTASLWLLAFVLLVSSCVSSKKYKAATADAQTAKTANEELTKKNGALQTQLNDAISGNKLLAEERDRYQKELEANKGQLKQVQGAVDDYTSNVDGLQKKAADRLADYAERGATVESKDGLVYITLQDELLFNKGTNKVSKDGESALAALASILNEDPNLKITVVGHTDDRAGRGGDSWSQSTERSSNVIRSLRTMKIEPSRLTSAGQGQFNAVADNSTAEGRAQNKRTQIILSPEAFKLLNKAN